MNNEDRAFLYACISGDGYIAKRLTSWGTYNYYLTITHSTKQAEYLSYKADRLNRILGRDAALVPINNSGYPGIRYSVGNSEVLGPLHDLFYPEGKKRIANPEILEVLTPESLAVWWMDDGSCTKRIVRGKYRGYLGYLSTYESYEDNLLIIKSINEKFGLMVKSASSKGKFRIYLNTSDLRNLRPIIEPFIVDSLKYKIDVCVPKGTSSPNSPGMGVDDKETRAPGSCTIQDDEIVSS